jgi:hypothetical protein
MTILNRLPSGVVPKAESGRQAALMSRTIFLLVLTVTLPLLAEPTAHPEPARLRVAKTHHDQAIKQAETIFWKAELVAKAAYLKEIKTALVDATKAGKLDDANEIAAVKATIEAEIVVLNNKISGIDSKILKVASDKGWQQVMEVRAGDILQINGEGTWCTNTGDPKKYTFDADGNKAEKNSDFIPNSRYGCLIGQIGSQRFVVGRTSQIEAKDNGYLELRINDKGIDDNSGELTITIFMKAK